MPLEKKRDFVIQEILDMVRRGDLSADGKLPSERDLAVRLGVSRVILREAIVALETLGVLETRERAGIYVREPELGGITESLRLMPFWPENFVPQFLEIRLIIDVSAAELAALRRTDQQLSRMKECLKTLRGIAIDTREGVRAQAHYEYLFHTLIIEAAQNEILSRIWEGLVSLVEKNNEIIHESLTRDENWAPRVGMQHEATLRAIEERDSVAAGQGMRTHLLEIRERYVVGPPRGEGRYAYNGLARP
jgi:GntR family transcriptional repressor for pyruvate dehydrogenase complex